MAHFEASDPLVPLHRGFDRLSVSGTVRICQPSPAWSSPQHIATVGPGWDPIPQIWRAPDHRNAIAYSTSCATERPGQPVKITVQRYYSRPQADWDIALVEGVASGASARHGPACPGHLSRHVLVAMAR